MARTLSSTTLSAAVSKDAKQFTLASVSGLSVGNLVFIGREAMLVNEIVGTRVSVQRGYQGTAPRAYASGTKAWFGAGSDFYATEPSGVADAAAEVVLPRVVLPTGTMFTVAGGQWVRISDEPKDSKKLPVFPYTAAGAIEIVSGIHRVIGSGALALTLAAPSTDEEGTELLIQSGSAHAHTVTISGGLAGAGSGADVGTFTAAIGNGVTLVAVNGVWHEKHNKGVTFA